MRTGRYARRASPSASPRCWPAPAARRRRRRHLHHLRRPARLARLARRWAARRARRRRRRQACSPRRGRRCSRRRPRRSGGCSSGGSAACGGATAASRCRATPRAPRRPTRTRPTGGPSASSRARSRPLLWGRRSRRATPRPKKSHEMPGMKGVLPQAWSGPRARACGRGTRRAPPGPSLRPPRAAARFHRSPPSAHNISALIAHRSAPSTHRPWLVTNRASHRSAAAPRSARSAASRRAGSAWPGARFRQSTAYAVRMIVSEILLIPKRTHSRFSLAGGRVP